MRAGQPYFIVPRRSNPPRKRRLTCNLTPTPQVYKRRVRYALPLLWEAKILRLYFGLDSPEPMTLEEIGAQLGITRERVRQIKEKALSRLRHVSRARALESYLG